MKILFSYSIIIMLLSIALYAVPGTITYQGKLTVRNKPAEGTFTMSFAIFNSETGGTRLWPSSGYENHSVEVSKGIYTAYLGAGSPPIPITSDVFKDNEAWIEIVVSGTAMPRTKIHTVPYAFQSDAITGVTPGAVAPGKPVVVDANKDVSGFRNVTIGTADNKYTLPNTRGAALQVLTSGSDGSTLWQDITGVLTEFRGNNIGDILVWNGTNWEPSSYRIWYRDSDGDGFGDRFKPFYYYQQLQGFVDNANDCNDDSPLAHNSAEEVCDGVDNDCDGTIDEGCRIYYLDNDGDGYGNPLVTISSTSKPDNYVENNQDCNDQDPTINPSATEIPDNGIDENCDGCGDESAVHGVGVVERVVEAAVEEFRDDEEEDEPEDDPRLGTRLQPRLSHDIADVGDDDESHQHDQAEQVLDEQEGVVVCPGEGEARADPLRDDLQRAEGDDDEAPEDEEVDDPHSLLEELLLAEDQGDKAGRPRDRTVPPGFRPTQHDEPHAPGEGVGEESQREDQDRYEDGARDGQDFCPGP